MTQVTHKQRTSITVYAQFALGMAVFGSATPVSKIVTCREPEHAEQRDSCSTVWE